MFKFHCLSEQIVPQLSKCILTIVVMHYHIYQNRFRHMSNDSYT